MKTIFVKDTNSKISISSYILNTFPNLPKGALFKALRNKDIKVNSKRIGKDILVNTNDKIDIYIRDNILYNIPKKIQYIYQDDNIAIVFKPQGLLSNNEYDNINEPTLEDLVKNDNSNLILCHRLDRNTCGLLMFAKSKKAYDNIMLAFKEDLIEKEYIAYVANYKFNENEKVLKQYISIDKKNGIAKIYNENNNLYDSNIKAISTSYKVLYSNKEKNYAILKVNIHNGKTHQIRASLASIGHPIIGDPKYGKNEINKKFKRYRQLLFAVKFNFNFKEDSYLYYLNKTNILLEDRFYTNYIGDIYEKIRQS